MEFLRSLGFGFEGVGSIGNGLGEAEFFVLLALRKARTFHLLLALPFFIH